ncbi:uncharacterized protein LOC144624132 [Crassostrea virginica]
MAEEIFNFLDLTNSTNSFKEFEVLWEEMGKELEYGNFPSSPQRTVTITPVDTTSSCTSDKFSTLEPLEPSTLLSPKYSPALDENWPPAINEETGEKFNAVEDSLLTTFRRKDPKKYKALEKKIRSPLQAREKVEEQFRLLRKIHKRMSEDFQQSSILLNYLEDQCSESKKKRVTFTTL